MSFGLIDLNPYLHPLPASPTSVFDVYDAFKKNFDGAYVLSDQIENFNQINKGQVVCKTNSNQEILADEDFFPILFGNNRYKDILGFKAQKIS